MNKIEVRDDDSGNVHANVLRVNLSMKLSYQERIIEHNGEGTAHFVIIMDLPSLIIMILMRKKYV